MGDCHAVAGDDDDFFCVHKSCCVIDFNRGFLSGFFNRSRSFHFYGFVHIGKESLERFCSVAKIHMDTVLTGVNRIVHACVAGFLVIVEDEDVFAIADIEDGHAVDRGAFCGVCSRVQDVVCTNNDGCIC